MVRGRPNDAVFGASALVISLKLSERAESVPQKGYFPRDPIGATVGRVKETLVFLDRTRCTALDVQ
jgi:hypothetical protein